MYYSCEVQLAKKRDAHRPAAFKKALTAICEPFCGPTAGRMTNSRRFRPRLRSLSRREDRLHTGEFRRSPPALRSGPVAAVPLAARRLVELEDLLVLAAAAPD